MFQCVHENARRNDYSRRRKVLLRTRSATLTRRAVANSQNSRRISRKLRGSSAEAPRKGASLQASGHVAWLAHWSPSLHRLRRNTTLLKNYFPFCANTRGSKSGKPCAAEGLRKQTMKHMCRRSSRKGPLGPRQGCGRVCGRLRKLE